jgi:hypothetical protein
VGVATTVTPEEALELIRQGEGQKVEFKQSFAEDRKAIESLCAFANADGGTVFLGVSPRGNVSGTAVGENTLENFSNHVRANTDPSLSPTIQRLALEHSEIVAVTVPKHARGQLFYAFGRPLIRIGPTNQRMSPDECRARLLEGQEAWSGERDRPRFEVSRGGVESLETQFAPEFKIRQFSGDPIANLEWRIRGPRFSMECQPAAGSALERTNCKRQFDLSKPAQPDGPVGLDEMGFEIRFHWRGRWRTELHRWPIERREFPHKVLWDVGKELLPPVESDEP